MEGGKVNIREETPEPGLFADSTGAISGLIRMSSFLLVHRGGLSHGRFLSCLQEENGGSECFSVPALS